MTKSSSIDSCIKIHFQTLDKRSAKTAFPSRGYLATELNTRVARTDKTNIDILIPPKVSSLIVTAAVESWLRGVHSFLISCSLTNSSPIWASVSGYYASHYCIRGLAHLLGFFQLYKIKRIVRIHINGGKHYCHIEKKKGTDGEHKYYWKIVKNDPYFENNPFFTFNKEDSGDSDVAHRHIANYHDHVDGFPNFSPLSKLILTQRVNFISKIELSSVPIPRKEKYPDIENVQLIAYHRLIKFRRFLDDILGGKNTFWKNYRNPSWSGDYLNFQVVSPRFLESYEDQ